MVFYSQYATYTLWVLLESLVLRQKSTKEQARLTIRGRVVGGRWEVGGKKP